MSKSAFLVLSAMLVVGCSTHEGNFGAEPDKASPSDSPAKSAEPEGPVTFHYAPDKSEYHYTVITSETPTAGPTRNAELDFVVKVGRKGDKFTNDTTVEAVLDGGVATPGSAERIKTCHVSTVLDAHGKVLSSKAAGAEGLLPAGAPDLGSSLALPAGPMKPGGTWTERVNNALGKFETSYTFLGIETVGKQRVATFEKEPTNETLVHSLRPTVIKVDADTGVLLDKLSDLTFSDEKTHEPVATAHLETKLR